MTTSDRAAALEECAKICDAWVKEADALATTHPMDEMVDTWLGGVKAVYHIAKQIRALKQSAPVERCDEVDVVTVPRGLLEHCLGVIGGAECASNWSHAFADDIRLAIAQLHAMLSVAPASPRGEG